MSNPFKQALIAAALESQDDAPVAAPAPEVLDEAVGEVADAAQDLDNATDDVNVLEEVQTGLEKICAAMESQSANLDPSAAGFMFEAANAYLARAGGSLSAAPSLESFNGKTAREAGVLSMETIKEQLVAIWEAIKAAFKKVFDAIMAFGKKIVVASEGLKARAEHLQKVAGSLHGEASAATFSDAGLAAKIAVGGKTDAAMTHFGDVVLMVDDMSSFGEEAVHDTNLGAEIGMKVAAAKTVAEFDAAVDGFKQLKGHAQRAYPVHKTVDGGIEHTTKELPGGYVLGFKSPEVDASKLSGMQVLEAHAKGTTPIVRRESAGEVSGELKTLSAADIKTVADGCLALVKDVQEMEGNAKKIQTSYDNLGSLIAKGRADEEGVEPEVLAKTKEFFSGLGKMGTHAMNIPLKLIGTLVIIGRNYIAYAEKSAALYGKKEEAAPAASEEPKKDEAAAAA